MIPFADWIRFHAAARPTELAVATPRMRLTFAQLFQASQSTAARLHKAGVKPGQKAAIFVVNPALMCVLLVALNRLGVTGCILPRWDLRRAAAMDAVGFDWLLTDNPQEQGGSARRLDVTLDWLVERADHGDLPAPYMIASDAHALIAISSGTTSKPKPIAFTAAQLERRITWRGFEEQATHPGERTYVLLNAASMLSFLTIFGTLYAGGTIYAGWPGDEPANVIAREGISRIVSTPPLMARHMPALDKQATRYPQLRLVYSGGDMLPESLSHHITERLCPNLITAFGTNETGQIAAGRVERMGFHPQRVGFLLPWAEVEVVDNNDRPLPSDTEGRLRFKTPGMATGYLDNPRATAEQFKGGWFYPGDIGGLTRDGGLIMGGRLSELISIPGDRFSPNQIDQVVSEHSGITEAAAFGVHRADGTDEIWLAVVAGDDIDMAALQRFCVARLGPRAPQHFLTLAQVPRNESGKVLRWALVDIATGKSA